MYHSTALAQCRGFLVLPGRVFPLIKAPALPSGGRDAGLGLEPLWKDRRGWEKGGDMMVVP